MDVPTSVPPYTRGESSQEEAIVAVSAAADFFLAQSNTWTVSLMENTQYIFGAPAFGYEEVEAFKSQRIVPLRFVLLHNDRATLKALTAVEGLVMAAVYDPKQAASYLVSAKALLRTQQARLERVDTRVLSDPGFQDHERYAQKRRFVALLFDLVHKHLANIQAIAQDAVAGRLDMPQPLDPIITSKLAATAFVTQDPPDAASLL